MMKDRACKQLQAFFYGQSLDQIYKVTKALAHLTYGVFW
jgi:hypothetical protein